MSSRLIFIRHGIGFSRLGALGYLVLAVFIISLCFLMLGSSASAQSGGGIGTGGDPGTGSGGHQSIYGYGWVQYQVSGPGPSSGFRNGTPWSAVQSTCQGAQTVIAFIVNNSSGQGRVYDYRGWNNANYLFTPGSLVDHGRAAAISINDARNAFNSLPSFGVDTTGFVFGHILNQGNVAWFCYNFGPPPPPFPVTISASCTPNPNIRARAVRAGSYNARLLRNGADTAVLLTGISGNTTYDFTNHPSWNSNWVNGTSSQFSVRFWDNNLRQESTSSVVSLGNCLPAARCLSVSAPATVYPGQAFTASFQVINSTSTNFPVNGAYRLGSQDPQDNQRWGTGRVLLNNAIPPGRTVTITGTFRATSQVPPRASPYTFSWMMLQEGVRWFGQPACTAMITVVQPPPSANCSISPIPSDMSFEIGQSFTVRITIMNTGSVAVNGSTNPLTYPSWPAGLSSGTRPVNYGSIPPGGSGYVDITNVQSVFPGVYNISAAVQGISDASCNRSVNIGTKPYLKTFGGEVMAGGNFGSTNCTPEDGRGGVHAWAEQRSGTYVGASAQLTVSSLLQINEFYSSSHGPASRPKGLTIANAGSTEADSTYGGGSGLGRCITDYYNDTREGDDLVSWSGNGSLPVGRDQYSLAGNNIGASGPVTVPAGAQAAIYVSGDVYIRNNITYASGAATWSNHPYLVVIASGDIRIAPGVTRLDGLFIAQTGTLYTCAPSVNGSYTTANVYDSCRNPLTVNGGLLGSDIRFLRMHGTLRDATPGETHSSTNTAEIIRYTPEMYLAPSPLAQPETTNTFGRYHSIRSLPPVF